MNIRKVFRSTIVAVVLGVVALTAMTPTADASVRNDRFYHTSTSDVEYIGVWNGYDGTGKHTLLPKGHFLIDIGIDWSVRSVYVPRHCDLWVKGAKWAYGWNSHTTFNIGKYPFVGRTNVKITC